MSTIVQTGFKLAQAVISNGQVTGNPWSNPDNLLLVDGDVSQSNPNNAASDVIIGNFNLNVPSTAVITGIEMKIFGRRGAETSPPITLTPVAVDNTSGVDTFYPFETPFTGLTESEGVYVLGSPTYKFATSWTPDQINNLKLQLIANGNIYLDCAQMNVYYYVPDTIDPPTPTGDSCLDCNSPIQVQPCYLALPLRANETKCYLKSLKYPDGTDVQYSDLGACGGYIDITFDPGKPKQQGSNFEENAFFAVWTVLPSGTVEVDFVTLANRGRAFHTPYDHDPDLLSDHDANSMVLISNNVHYEDRYVRKCQADVLFSKPIVVEEDGVEKTAHVHKINLKGAGVIVTVPDPIGAPDDIDVEIPGAGGTIPPQITAHTSITSGNTQVDTLSVDLDISGLNRGVPIQISTEEGVTVTGVTVGGVAATQEAVATDAPNNLRSESWMCVNPPLGTQPVVVTLSAPAYLTFGAECMNGIDTANPIGDTQSATGNDNNPTLVVTTDYDNSAVIDALATAQTPILYTPGAGQAANWAQTANTTTRQGGSSIESAGLSPDAVTMDYSITQSTPWAYTAIEIKGISTPASTGDHKVKATVADTTPGFLDSKLSVVSGDASVLITKTIVNPGADEIVRYDLRVTGGGGPGGGGTPTFIDQTPSDGTYGLLAGDVDGVNTQFTVSQGIFATSKLQVFLNGLIQLQGASDDWEETDPATGKFDFITPPLSGDIITVVYQTTATASGAAPFTINQTGHGFSVGDYIRPTTNQWTFSQGNNATNAECWAQVTVVIDSDNFTAVPLVGTRQQQTNIVALIAGFAGGDPVYLSATTPGGMTNVAPTTVGQVTKPIGYVEANDVGVPISLLSVNYRGQINQSTPVSSNGLLHSFTDTTLTIPPTTTPIIVDTYVIPANTFAVGDVIRIAVGTTAITNALNSGDNTFQINGGAIIAHSSAAANGVTNELTSTLIGVIKAGNTIEYSLVTMRNAGGTPAVLDVLSSGSSPFDPTTSNTIDLVVTSGTALGGYSGSFNNVAIEKV